MRYIQNVVLISWSLIKNLKRDVAAKKIIHHPKALKVQQNRSTNLVRSFEGGDAHTADTSQMILCSKGETPILQTFYERVQPQPRKKRQEEVDAAQ